MIFYRHVFCLAVYQWKIQLDCQLLLYVCGAEFCFVKNVCLINVSEVKG